MSKMEDLEGWNSPWLFSMPVRYNAPSLLYSPSVGNAVVRKVAEEGNHGARQLQVRYTTVRHCVAWIGPACSFDSPVQKETTFEILGLIRKFRRIQELGDCQNIDLFAPHDGFWMPLISDTNGQVPNQAEHDCTGNERDSVIFEFFDLENAALAPDDGQPSPSGPQPSTTATTVTLRSLGSESTLRLPSEASTYTIWDVAHNLAAASKSHFARSTTPAGLENWPFEHIAIHAEPRPDRTVHQMLITSDVTQSSSSRKRTLEEDVPGTSCFDSRVGSCSTGKRKKTDEQRNSFRKVRAQGACLRCSVQKLKCSAGLPCEQCQALFNRAYGSKTLKWTACVSSNLPDINIFALGITLSGDGYGNSGPQVGIDTAMALYKAVFDLGFSSGIISEFDALYTEVLGYIYGHRAPEVHPFIREERNPLHMLIQLNVILLGSPIIGPKLIGYIAYLQKLRAICGVVVFECLGKALDRKTLAASTLSRQQALIVQVALLLDQVLGMKGTLPAAAVCFAQGPLYSDMHQHLVQYVSHYFQKLMSGVFGRDCKVTIRFENADSSACLGEAFWSMLSDLMPSVPLRKPPKLREYADMTWKTHYTGLNLGQIYRDISRRCPVPCF